MADARRPEGRFRSLRKSPTFTIALAVLALGIGVATALYSVVDAVVLRGLPFDEHDRLMVVTEYETTRQTMVGGGTITPQYLDWRQQQQSFEGLTAISNGIWRLRNESGAPAEAGGIHVTHEFFHALRVTPLLGRALSADDEVFRTARVVLSYSF